ncbi:MAG: hypothetical protein M9882_02375 [Homoserinimonas sp.]|nr:hypothetical protein [Homoserinimonas sp.]MCW5944763.1 hypothetical protein [Cryobacterium sp.]
MRPISRIRVAGIIGVLALLSAMLMPTAAQAATGDTVIVFSNSSVVDTSNGVDGGEYEWISNALTAAGYNVVPFDGGNGQDTTWATELSGVDYFVLPEQENADFYDSSNPPTWMSADAWDVFIAWIQDGGHVLISGSCYSPSYGGGTAEILDAALGVNYDNVLSCAGSPNSIRWVDDSSLPNDIPYVNGTYAMNLGAFSQAQLEPLTVWYAGTICDDTFMTAGVFKAGDPQTQTGGTIAFEAWDYFNDDESPSGQAAWNQVLPKLLENSTTSSTWGGHPITKAPISATTPSGQKLYTVGAPLCEDSSELYRVNPGSGGAILVGSGGVEGNVGQGAIQPSSGKGFIPVEDEDSNFLYSINMGTGGFQQVGEFSSGGLDIYKVFGIAISDDGTAYAFADYSDPDQDGAFLGLFTVDLNNAELTLVGNVDDDDLVDPYAFAFDPANGKFYVIDRYLRYVYSVDVSSAVVTVEGRLDGEWLVTDSWIYGLQIDTDGTFWVAHDTYMGDYDESGFGDWVGVLVKFTLADLDNNNYFPSHFVGFLVDDPIVGYSLLLGRGSPELADTGIDWAGASGIGFGGGVALLLGLGLIVARRRMQRHKSA